ncbi:hypothetical protein [Crocosphaera sp.]|uniref:hypothetical protein n=1 Tax=Crocosphaera sp. TaxID=2729996 RepID=UPI0026062DD9|nr:hypothetical protein [Crocosphaera sp.]MDJ0582705.1 hypothetical protein [Crocosphaera sp.]
MKYLKAENNSLQDISETKFLFIHISQSFFVEVRPYQDDYGLHWLVINVLPESDFILNYV